MSKFREYISHPEVRFPLVLAVFMGLSVIAMAFFSKKILHVKIRGFYEAIPGFILIAAEALRHAKIISNKNSSLLYGILGIVISTVIIIWAYA